MQPRKHLMATCSVLLMAALLAACAAPAAAPAPPADTPMPPTDTPAPPVAESDPVAVVQAWGDAIYSGDVNAALDLFTDDGKYLVYYTAYGREDMRWVFNWLAGLETKQENFDCQSQDDKLACTYMVLDGCIAAFDPKGLPVKATFTLQDGKIKEATGYGTGPEWDAYWNFVPVVQSWERVFRPEEYAYYTKNEGTFEAGKVAIKLCREYENAIKTQEPATLAAAQVLVDALNSGDAGPALALLTDDAKFGMLNDKAAGAEELRLMFDWLAGKETQYQIADCEWQGISTQCAVTVIDGCIAASGAAEGLHGKMTFYSQEDGTLRQVNVAPSAVERKGYQAWLEAEAAWASANRADELAQAEGYSREAGAMAVKLCQEYATAASTTDATSAQSGSAAAGPLPIIWDDDGSIDGVTALLYLLRNPSFDVKAATISPGIAHPEVFAPNLARFLTLLGVEDVPVAAGPEQLLAGDNAFPAEWRAASDKFWDLELPEGTTPVDDRTASQLIVDVVKGSEQPVTLFISGSLTNLAQALRDDPGIKDNIRSVEIMGGAVKSPGNVESVPAEWNIYIDPVAASEVFASGLDLHLTPLDATDQVPWAEADATAWEASNAPAGSIAAQFLRRTLKDWSSQEILIWDLVAALNAANRDLCEWQNLHLEIVTDDAATEGQTVVVDGQPANVSVCLSPDVDAYRVAAQQVLGMAP